MLLLLRQSEERKLGPAPTSVLRWPARDVMGKGENLLAFNRFRPGSWGEGEENSYS